MGNKIEFPYNNKVYLRQTLKCMEKNRYEEALTYIEKVYETNQTHYVNRIFTLILYTLEKYEEAFDVANKHKDLYLKDNYHIFMYILLLIKNHQFIEAEALIQQNKDSHSLNEEKWVEAERELKVERERVNRELEKKRVETKNKLLDISQYSIFEQSQIIKDAHLLKIEDLQDVAPNLFNHPFISGHIQRAFLELLIEMKDENTYAFPWFNDTKEIIPKNLVVFDQLHTVEQVKQLLENKLHKNPSMIEGIQGEIISDLLLLYPFVDEIVTDVDYWVEAYIKFFNPVDEEMKPISGEEKELQQWIEKLNKNSQRK